MDDDGLIVAEKTLPGGRTAQVVPMSYGKGRVCVGPTGSMVYDDAF